METVLHEYLGMQRWLRKENYLKLFSSERQPYLFMSVTTNVFQHLA